MHFDHRYALLLRGVNVGKKNSLPMAELQAMLTKLGCSDVQTYLQSGNAVFATKLQVTTLTRMIEKALEDFMGRAIAITLRRCNQMQAIINANPFTEMAIHPTNLCVTFLSHLPSKSEIAPLVARD